MTRMPKSNFLRLMLLCCCLLMMAPGAQAQNATAGSVNQSADEAPNPSPWDEAGAKDPFGDDAKDPFAETDPQKDASSPAPWEEAPARKQFEFDGQLKNKFAFDIHKDNPFEDLYLNHLQVQLGGTYRPSSAVETKIAVGADLFHYTDDTSDWENDSDLRVFDAWINLAGSGFNLKLGNQIVRWGKTDGYSPLDNVNPEDLRAGIGGRREDRKIHIPMANLEIFTGPVTLQALYIPFFVKSKYDRKDTDWALFDHYDEQVGGFGTRQEDVANTFENGEAGLRLSGIIGKVDYALSYLTAHEDVGSLESLAVPPGFAPTFSSRVIRDLTGYASLTDQDIYLRYDRQHIYGLEMETTLAVFGIRGDFVYTDSVSFVTEQLQRTTKPVAQYVLGADYNGPSAFYINVQFGQVFIQDFDDDILLADELSSNISGTISKEFLNGDLKFEFRCFYDLDGDGTLYNPKAIIKPWQNVKVELGVELFDGTDEHPLGFYRDNDQAYVLLQWAI